MARQDFNFKCDGSVRDTEYEALKNDSSISTAQDLVPTYTELRERVIDESKRHTTVVRPPYVWKKYKGLVRLSGSIDERQRNAIGRLFGEK